MSPSFFSQKRHCGFHLIVWRKNSKTKTKGWCRPLSTWYPVLPYYLSYSHPHSRLNFSFVFPAPLGFASLFGGTLLFLCSLIVVLFFCWQICELAAKNPKNYLSLAPQFYTILTTSTNNWVLIKVVKLVKNTFNNTIISFISEFRTPRIIPPISHFFFNQQVFSPFY